MHRPGLAFQARHRYKQGAIPPRHDAFPCGDRADTPRTCRAHHDTNKTRGLRCELVDIVVRVAQHNASDMACGNRTSASSRALDCGDPTPPVEVRSSFTPHAGVTGVEAGGVSERVSGEHV